MSYFQEMIDKVRIYFEVARLIDTLPQEIYNQFTELENIILLDEADEDEVESIIYTVADTLSPCSSSDDWREFEDRFGQSNP